MELLFISLVLKLSASEIHLSGSVLFTGTRTPPHPPPLDTLHARCQMSKFKQKRLVASLHLVLAKWTVLCKDWKWRNSWGAQPQV